MFARFSVVSTRTERRQRNDDVRTATLLLWQKECQENCCEDKYLDVLEHGASNYSQGGDGIGHAPVGNKCYGNGNSFQKLP